MTERLKILHCANFSNRKNGAAYYATDRKISNGFTRNGHMVVDFSYRDTARAHSPLKIKALGIKKMNQLLLKTVERMRPDILVLGHTELVKNETLRKIRAAHPDIKIVMWFVDWIRKIQANKRFFSRRVALLDALFTSTDTALVQAIFTDSSQHAKIYFLPNICDSSIDTGRSFEQSKLLHDIVFVGRYDTRRKSIISLLRDGSLGLNIGLYGQSAYSLLLGHDYIKVLASSTMALNFSRDNTISLYSSDRMVHLTANGCLTFSPQTPNMRSIFSDKEVVYFSDMDDLKAKLAYYAAHPNEAAIIAKAGYKRAHKDYECAVVTRQILTALNS